MDCQPLLQERCDLICVLNYNDVEFTHVKLLLVLSGKCIVDHRFSCSSNPVGGESGGSHCIVVSCATKLAE